VRRQIAVQICIRPGVWGDVGASA